MSATEQGERVVLHHVAMSALRKLIKDYVLICDSYHNAIRTAAPSQIEAHRYGPARACTTKPPKCCRKRSPSKFTIDLETARRLFTLVCALHVRG